MNIVLRIGAFFCACLLSMQAFGATILYQNDFQSGAWITSDNIFNKKCRGEQFTIVTDPINAIPGNLVYRALQRGNVGCTEGSLTRYRTQLTFGLTAVAGQPLRVNQNEHTWIGFRMYINPSTPDGSDRTFILAQDVGESAVLIKGNDTLNVMPVRYRVWSGSSFGALTEENISNHPLLQGWNHIVIHQYKRTSTQGDGIYRLWLNGTKVIDLSNVITGSDRIAAGQPQSTFDLGPYHGTTVRPGDTDIYFDDLIVAIGADAESIMFDSGTYAVPDITSFNGGSSITAIQTRAEVSATGMAGKTLISCAFNGAAARQINWDHGNEVSGILDATDLYADAASTATVNAICDYRDYDAIIPLNTAKWSTSSNTEEYLFDGDKIGYTTGITTVKTGIGDYATNYIDLGTYQAVAGDQMDWLFDYSVDSGSEDFVHISVGDETSESPSDRRILLTGTAGSLDRAVLNTGFGDEVTNTNLAVGEGVYRLLLSYKVSTETPIQTYKIRFGSKGGSIGHTAHLHKVVVHKNAAIYTVSENAHFENADTDEPTISDCVIDLTRPKDEDTLTNSYTASIGCTTDEIGGTVYAMITTSNTAPDVADVQAGTGAIWSASSPADTTLIEFESSGMAYQDLWGWVVHQDAAGNKSTVATATFDATNKALQLGTVADPIMRGSVPLPSATYATVTIYSGNKAIDPTATVVTALQNVPVVNGVATGREEHVIPGQPSLNSIPNGTYWVLSSRPSGATYALSYGQRAIVTE